MTVNSCQKSVLDIVCAAVFKKRKSTLIFTKEDLEVNINVYIDKILTRSIREMKKHFKNKALIFQQDGTSLHITKKTEAKF